MDHGPLMKWLPRAQSAQQDYAAEESDCAPGERNEYGFGEESPQNAPSARSESEPKSDFPRTVSGARGEQTAQVSARGQQNERRQQHQACQKCPYRTAKIIAIKAWTSQGKGYIAFIFGVSLFSDMHRWCSGRQSPVPESLPASDVRPPQISNGSRVCSGHIPGPLAHGSQSARKSRDRK